jgi:hypothetical protein
MQPSPPAQKEDAEWTDCYLYFLGTLSWAFARLRERVDAPLQRPRSPQNRALAGSLECNRRAPLTVPWLHGT